MGSTTDETVASVADASVDWAAVDRGLDASWTALRVAVDAVTECRQDGRRLLDAVDRVDHAVAALQRLAAVLPAGSEERHSAVRAASRAGDGATQLRLALRDATDDRYRLDSALDELGQAQRDVGF